MKSKLAVLLLFSGALAIRGAETPDQVNGIAALVGESVITYEQVQRAIARTVDLERARYANQPDAFRQAALQAQRLGIESLVQRRLILQAFEDLKVPLPESFIEDNVQDEIKKKYGDRATLTKTLQQDGITYETYRREVREQFIEVIMRGRNVPRDILISPGRIERYYNENLDKFKVNEQVKFRMIFIDKARSAVNAKDLGREILAKLQDGADFAEMAAVYSDSPSARDGGAYGWTERKQLRDDLADAVFSLTQGQRSDLIEKAEGIYILQVEEAREARVRPVTEVREEIERTLVNAERMRLTKSWLEKLRKKSFVRYFY
ncbi:MAG: peptidylprolyl isomerase [Verrucomicrobiales bacterium]|nr:peptidylprolyl isomerase [Verrucomicrobiales bacterium]